MAKPTRSMTGANEPGGASIGWADRPAGDVTSGTVLSGKYRLISEIGRGGMGSVWRAEHLGWDAPVAIKLMNRDITAHPEAIARFEREVRLAAGLRSPHVVQVLDHGVDAETGSPFIAMELLEGESLARRLKRACLSPAETFDVFSQLVRALSRAHAAGIVHRDLKPDNVFLVRNDEESLAKVLDFGVAKWTAPDIVESGLTRPGSVVGTPYYMSPEQIQGSREIDHRADLWALAAIACECLTGQRPFEAPDFAQLAVLLLGNVGRPLPSNLGPVPPGFDGWFLRATDPDINRRFQSAREMAQTLAVVCDVAPSSGGDASYPGRQQPAHTRHDAPSMAPVSNTASRLQLPTPVWQRPMARLVGTTVGSMLLVVAGIAVWVLTRGSHVQPSEPPTHEPSPPLVNAPLQPSAPPKSNDAFGIRPILNDGSQTLPPPGAHPIDTDDTLTPSPPVSTDDFDRDATQRRVRAAMLQRGRDNARPHRSGGKGPAARATPSRATSSGVSAGATASRAKAPPPVEDKPAPADSPEPTVVTKPPAERAPSVVDGRVIRTTL